MSEKYIKTFENFNTRKKLAEVIAEAIKSTDLNHSVRMVQDFFDVEDGDRAGIFFSSHEDIENKWSSMDLTEKTYLLIEYAKSELNDIAKEVEMYIEDGYVKDTSSPDIDEEF